MSRGPGDRPVVLKFGGAAVEDLDSVEDHLRAGSRGPPHRTIVVSARKGTTDLLYRLFSGGDGGRTARVRARLFARFGELRGEARDLRRRLEGRLASLPKATPGSRDAGIAFGERITAAWLADELRVRGWPAVAVPSDAAGLRTDGRFGNATIDLHRSRVSVRRTLEGFWRRGKLPIVTGFFGRGPDGQPRLLGRGGSDYSATSVARIIGAARVDLVKSGGPIRTADPDLIERTRAVPHLSYAEAEELAQFGSRTLHPLAIGPAREGGIPIRVVGVDPRGPTTRIDGRTFAPGPRLVTSLRGLRLLTLRTAGGRQRSGGLFQLSQWLAANQIPVIAMFDGAAELRLAIPARAQPEIRGLAGPGDFRFDRPARAEGRRCLVAVIGSAPERWMLRVPPTVLSRAEQLLLGGSAISMILREAEERSALGRLHTALVDEGQRGARRPGEGS